MFGALGRERARRLRRYAGVPMQHLDAAGRRFVREFGAIEPGGIVTADALYTAQATEILLDAIARSDGSRASVRAHCSRPGSRAGLIGDVRFDANGDIRPRPFHFFRLTPRACRRARRRRSLQ